tara:strand:- start:19491 stop:19940 length:450 start_codon:yes stop_codon:yes gene_type:complete
MIKTNRFQTCLLFNGKANEAAKYYVSIFKKNSKITSSNPTASTFLLNGNPFIALNGPKMKPTYATSTVVFCETQREVDYFWNALSKGGHKGQCGWLKDKYGFSWQIVPTVLDDLFDNKDREKSQRAMNAMLKMRKLDIAKLKRAYAGKK